MRVNRLLEMVTLLLNRETITAREFAARFEVSTRTVFRDVEDLSSAGVPIYMNRGKGGGISLLKEFTLDRTLISRDETDSLLMAVKTLQAARYPEIDRFLEKLEGLFPHPDVDNWIEVDFSPWGRHLDENEKFNNIRLAILKKKELHFDYINAEGIRSNRRIYPLCLIFKSQSWYLRGYCLDREGYRTFRLTRVKHLKVSQQIFTTADLPPDRGEDDQSGRKPVTSVKLRFLPDAAFRVYDDFDDGLVKRDPDGRFIVTIDLTEDEWTYGFILSYGSSVEVLEPVNIRKLIRQRLIETLNLY